MNRFYVEHSAITPEIRELERTGRIELVHFPYDPNSRSRRLKKRSKPSAAQIQDLNMPISELPGTWDDYKGSEHLAAIQNVIGPDNRRDALHIDSAYKSGCLAFVTCDSDILDHCEELTKLLGLRFFHPNRDAEAITHLGRQMSLPLGIKFFITFLVVMGTVSIIYMAPLITWFNSVESTSYNWGLFFGSLVRQISLTSLYFAGAIGLLKLKRWGINLTLFAILLCGVFFAIGFTEGLTKLEEWDIRKFVVFSLTLAFPVGLVLFLKMKYFSHPKIQTLFCKSYT